MSALLVYAVVLFASLQLLWAASDFCERGNCAKGTGNSPCEPMEACEICEVCGSTCALRAQCALHATTTTTTVETTTTTDTTTTETTSTSTIPVTTTTSMDLEPEVPLTLELECGSSDFTVMVHETLLTPRTSEYSGFIIEVNKGPTNLAVVWFVSNNEWPNVITLDRDQNSLGCSMETGNKLTLSDLKSQSVYTICWITNGDMALSPFQCTTLFSSTSPLDSMWLEMTDRTLSIVLILVGSIVTVVVGAGLMVLILCARTKVASSKAGESAPSTQPNNLPKHCHSCPGPAKDYPEENIYETIDQEPEYMERNKIYSVA